MVSVEGVHKIKFEETTFSIWTLKAYGYFTNRIAFLPFMAKSSMAVTPLMDQDDILLLIHRRFSPLIFSQVSCRLR
jgi:hypothetical protein